MSKKYTLAEARITLKDKHGNEFHVIYKPIPVPPTCRPDKQYHASVVWKNDDRLASYTGFEQPSITSATRMIEEALKKSSE